MAIRTILTEPNKILRQISQPVKNVGKEEQNLMNDMLETMYAAELKTVQAAIMHITRDLKKDGLPGPAVCLILLLNSRYHVLIS